MRLTSIFFFLFFSILIETSVQAAPTPMPPPRRNRNPSLYPRPPIPLSNPNINSITQYEQLYQAHLQPLQLYHPEPPHSAPLFSPRGSNIATISSYTQLITSSDHSAYISPSTSKTLDPVLHRLISLIHNDNNPSIRQQRGFLSLLEEAKTRSIQQLLSPLHPENLAAQHNTPLEALLNKHMMLSKIIDNPNNIEKLTNGLSEEDKKRFEDALEVLEAEKELLKVAVKGYAGKFPHF